MTDRSGSSPVAGIRVVDWTTEIAGPYCTKLLADAGADVHRVEPPGGDPLARHRSGGLHAHLNAGKRRLVLDRRSELPAGTDVVVTNDPEQARTLHEADPAIIVVCITPFGMDGPWAGRPATELTLQAACGSTGSRGDPELPPLPAGGRLGEWITGTYAAVATIAAIGIDGRPTAGRLIDVAMLDCMAVTLVTYPSVTASFAGWPPMEGTGRVIEVPSIEPTADGFSVITTNSAQQLKDLLVMIGRGDWLDDEGFARVSERFARRREFLAGVHEYTRCRTTAAVLDDAGLFRIPAGPVLDGSNVAEFEQFRARGVYVASPAGPFRQPRPPYRISAGPAAQPRNAVPVEELGPVRAPTPRRRGAPPESTARRPLAGVRVLDCTAWWAGPAATHVLACLGADVIKVESETRPDPMRMASARRASDPDWLEWSPIYHAVNASKRAITLDLTTADGVATFERLTLSADVVVENYTPRVMEQFGLGWERLHELNPRLVMVRMPAFGLDGPWRDRTGFAQTMECISGMAWVTGFPDSPPVLVRGACDPVAGLHAVFATFLALRSRSEDGGGRLVEVPMVECALNVTAEQVIEWDVSGVRLDRRGARGDGAPEGVYPCSGHDRWVAVSVMSDEQWHALRRVMDLPDEVRWATRSARAEHLDELDELIRAWSRHRSSDAVVDILLDAGVPAAAVVRGRDIAANPQLRHRGLFEPEVHPVTGRHELPTLPFHFDDIDAWLYGPAPRLGEHNVDVLGELATPADAPVLARPQTD